VKNKNAKKYKMLLLDEVNDEITCPLCNSELEQKNESYAILTKGKGVEDTFIIGSDAGYFCKKCPTIVMDRKILENMLFAGIGHENFSYLVAGIADLDAIPEDKEDIPLGDDDNPIPLIPFEELPKKQAKPIKETIGRNDPCPCGSGKKYKKCCMEKDNTISLN
jgi:hypothetical protein